MTDKFNIHDQNEFKNKNCVVTGIFHSMRMVSKDLCDDFYHLSLYVVPIDMPKKNQLKYIECFNFYEKLIHKKV